MFEAQVTSDPVIQFPLFIGGANEAGFTHEPGAHELLISVEMYVNPIGLGGLLAYQEVEANHSGSVVPGAPCPVDKVIGLGNCCAFKLFEKIVQATIKMEVKVKTLK